MKRLLIILVMSVFYLPNLSEAGTKDAPSWPRDVRPYRQRQRENRPDYQAYVRKENYSFLQNKFNKDNTLAEQDKKDLIVIFENQYQKLPRFTEEKYAKDLAFFEGIVNNNDLSLDQKKDAIETGIKETLQPK